MASVNLILPSAQINLQALVILPSHLCRICCAVLEAKQTRTFIGANIVGMSSCGAGMIAGGTGVTPMYQVANAILKNPADKTEITLLFANVSADDILIEEELTNLQALSPQFKVRCTSQLLSCYCSRSCCSRSSKDFAHEYCTDMFWTDSEKHCKAPDFTHL